MKAGFLLKQGHVRKNWKKRWFVLQGDMLFYFKTKEDPIPISYIPLTDCVITEIYARKNTLRIEQAYDDKIYLITAQDLDEMNEWREALLVASHQYSLS